MLRKRPANRREWLFSSIVLRTLNAAYAKCCEKKKTHFLPFTPFSVYLGYLVGLALGLVDAVAPAATVGVHQVEGWVPAH